MDSVLVQVREAGSQSPTELVWLKSGANALTRAPYFNLNAFSGAGSVASFRAASRPSLKALRQLDRRIPRVLRWAQILPKKLSAFFERLLRPAISAFLPSKNLFYSEMTGDAVALGLLGVSERKPTECSPSPCRIWGLPRLTIPPPRMR